MNQDPEVRKYFPRLLTAAESAGSVARISGFISQNGYGFFAVDVLEAGDFIGFVGLSRPDFEAWFTPCVEIGWRLKRSAWGFGYATEAATACLAYGLSELGLERIYAFAVASNERSVRVMRKIGMRFVGEFDHPRIEEGNWLRRHVLYEAGGGAGEAGPVG